MAIERSAYRIFESKATTRSEIEEEVEQYRREHGKGWGMGYFNNFFLHVNLSNSGLFNYRTVSEKFGDVPYGELVKDDAGYSHKFKSVTPKQFYGEFDHTIAEHAMSQEAVDTLVKENRKDDLYELLVPVYIDLRVGGYGHYKDLTA